MITASITSAAAAAAAAAAGGGDVDDGDVDDAAAASAADDDDDDDIRMKPTTETRYPTVLRTVEIILLCATLQTQCDPPRPLGTLLWTA